MIDKEFFFIIGAPKCGTTSLANWLSEHPDVYFSPIKEPHFFNDDMSNRKIKTLPAYKKLFKNVRHSHKIIGEGSTWYLYSESAVPNIEKTIPNAKYIVMTRDPTQMAFSLYLHNHRKLHEDQPTFEDAWHLQKQRVSSLYQPKHCDEPNFLQYFKACSLGTQIERLFSHVDKDRVLIIRLEDLKAEPAREYIRALNFLGLSNDNRKYFPPANESRSYKSEYTQILFKHLHKIKLLLGLRRSFHIASMNDKKSEKPKLDENFSKLLDNKFSDERQKLHMFQNTLE